MALLAQNLVVKTVWSNLLAQTRLPTQTRLLKPELLKPELLKPDLLKLPDPAL